MDKLPVGSSQSHEFFGGFFNKKTVFAAVGVLLVIVFLLVSFLLFDFFSTTSQRKAYLMGTTVEIKAEGPHARVAAREAMQLMKNLSQKLNYRKLRSEVGLVNNMAGISKVAVTHETFDVISRSIKLSKTLGGVFDITAGPLIELWDYRKGIIPEPAQISEAKQLVNWADVELDPETETVFLKKRGMKLDLGGVGKGFVVARGREILLSRGIKSAIINCGSSITVIGTRPDGKFWTIGIQDPRKPGETIGIVELMPGQALSTSGDYERYFERDGKRYCHIIDPRSGFPADGCQSVTIIAPDAMIADMLSTAVFIMGPSVGMKFIENLSGIDGLIIDANGRMIKSNGFRLKEGKI